jgi:DNA-binding NarL/FixJ family response regulator
MTTINLVLVDDHKLIREAWSLLLDSDPLFSVIGQAHSAEEGIELCGRLLPDIVLLDINLPAMDGIEAVPRILKVAPTTKILGVSLHTRVSYARKMIRAGASGYLTKNASQKEMKQALISITDGKTYIGNEIKDILAGQVTGGDNLAGKLLSSREVEIIELVKVGLSSKEIAAAKSISVKTVDAHRYNILKKLKLRNSAELVNYINQHELN